jgi:bacteriocin biosynthesis cyclodehydratase domain-containing protein
MAAHRSVLHRGPTGRLLGLDPHSALAVDGLSPALASMLDELAAPVERDALVARAVGRGAPAGAARDLLRRLLDAGALIDAAGPERVARRRAAATVTVVGGGPVAAGIAIGLALAGIGALFLEAAGAVGTAGRDAAAEDADARVCLDDVGTGLLDADVGRPREEALADAVRRVAPGVRVGPPRVRAVADVCVLADVAAPLPLRVAALHRDRIPHLPVRLRDGVGLVGPLVLPGRSACLGCVELHRGARDPDWPAVAAQLVGRCGRGDAAAATAIAALGVAQILAALDATGGGGGPEPAPPTLGATLELDLMAGALVRRVWVPHPGCACRAPLGQTCGPPEGRGTIME